MAGHEARRQSPHARLTRAGPVDTLLFSPPQRPDRVTPAPAVPAALRPRVPRHRHARVRLGGPLRREALRLAGTRLRRDRGILPARPAPPSPSRRGEWACPDRQGRTPRARVLPGLCALPQPARSPVRSDGLARVRRLRGDGAGARLRRLPRGGHQGEDRRPAHRRARLLSACRAGATATSRPFQPGPPAGAHPRRGEPATRRSPGTGWCDSLAVAACAGSIGTVRPPTSGRPSGAPECSPTARRCNASRVRRNR